MYRVFEVFGIFEVSDVFGGFESIPRNPNKNNNKSVKPR